MALALIPTGGVRPKAKPRMKHNGSWDYDDEGVFQWGFFARTANSSLTWSSFRNRHPPKAPQGKPASLAHRLVEAESVTAHRSRGGAVDDTPHRGEVRRTRSAVSSSQLMRNLLG
jgi:hypothetical protein